MSSALPTGNECWRVYASIAGWLFGVAFKHCYRDFNVRCAAILEAMMARLKHHELLKGLIRLHILHHAAPKRNSTANG
jgi:hypothetical protein